MPIIINNYVHAYKKMDPKSKKKWLKALRSGKYEQTTYRLCEVEDGHFSYCCLGVLAEECIVGDWICHPHRAGEGYSLEVCRGKTFVRGYGMLPPAALRQVGLDRHAAEELAALNDDEGKSFKQIANWIEKNL